MYRPTNESPRVIQSKMPASSCVASGRFHPTAAIRNRTYTPVTITNDATMSVACFKAGRCFLGSVQINKHATSGNVMAISLEKSAARKRIDDTNNDVLL